MPVFNKVKNFLKEVKIELKKVVYPNREEVIGSTKVVILTVFTISIFLGLIDLGLSKLVRQILQ